jgi:hypothetical protein
LAEYPPAFGDNRIDLRVFGTMPRAARASASILSPASASPKGAEPLSPRAELIYSDKWS